MVLIYGNDLPDYKNLATYAPPVATRLYASDGSLLIEYAEERRVFIDYDDMPAQLVNAFIAAEDQNFWTHPGIDVQGIIRATTNNAMRMIGYDASFSGASTITQQVAKNFFLSSERTISRKIKEAILALRLERTFSKQHILTLYLNHIFLGARAYGVGSAALMYFNKPVSELSLAQCAFLASLPKAPNNRENAIERRNYVLRRMVEEGFVTQSEADAADLCVLNEKTDKVVVSAAAKHGAVVFGRLVKHLKYRSRVIIKAANDAKIKDAIFVDVHFTQSLKEGQELLRTL